MTGVLVALVALGHASEISRDRPGDAMPDRHWDITHLDLDLKVDLKARTVQGRTTHTFRPLGRPTHTLRLHQSALDIQAIEVDGEAVDDWRIGDHTLDVPVATEADEHTVSITYAATPQTGLHFRDPAGSSDPVLEVWSQGEDTDNRHWFPSWDHPSDKFTVDTHLTVRDGLTALANGIETGREPAEPGWTRWSYRMERPIVNYLVALAIGDYRVVKEDGPVPLEYVSASIHAPETIRRGFDRAKPQMVFLAELLDEPFPYPVYRQVVVSRFMYGGMENATLTVMADTMLQPVEGGRIRRTEDVTAHELAHQWFGDLLTCYGWRELWLNEGFATFYTGRWVEHEYGPEAYAAKVRGWRESAARLTSPMSPRGWSAVDGRENEGVYVRGAMVLHMLRVYLGDEVFDEGIRLYVDRHADRLVESDDLRRALEDVSGTHLGWFFDQWVHGVGVPSLSSSWRWADGQLTVTLRQTTEGTPFWAPVEIEVGGAEVLTRRVWLGEGEARLVLDLEAPPEWVAVDPWGGVLAAWDHQQDTGAWIAQATRSPSAFARITAIEALGEADDGAAAAAALVGMLGDDGLATSVHRYAAGALGALSTPEARVALLDALDAPDPYLRARVAEALGQTEDHPDTQAALARVAKSDPDAHTAAEALAAIAELDAKRGRTMALGTLVGADRSWQKGRHAGALQVLGDVGERSDLAVLIDKSKARQPRWVRQRAGFSAGSLITRFEADNEGWSERARVKISRVWIEALDDPDQRVRHSAIQILGNVGSDAAEDALARFAATNEVPGLSESARTAAMKIRRRRVTDDEPVGEKDADRLQEELDELRERLERLEEWR